MLLALKTGAVGRQRAAVLTGLEGSLKDGGVGGKGVLGGSGSRPPEKPEEGGAGEHRCAGCLD